MIATSEIKELRKGRGRFTLNAKILAQFLLSTIAVENELLNLQKLKDLELKRILINADPHSDFQISDVTQNTIKLLSGQPSSSLPTDFDDSDIIDLVEDEESIDITNLRTFGDY